MKRSLLVTVFLAAALLAAPGCKKKQPPPPPQTMPPAGAQQNMPGSFHGEAAVEKQVVVPDDVRKSWKAVRIEIASKETKEKKRYVVPLSSDFKVPDTGLTLKAGPFFPDFHMDPVKITSESNRPQNPAARVEVYEGGKKVFQGWLFAKYPDIHPFTHEKYGVTLIEGIAK